MSAPRVLLTRPVEADDALPRLLAQAGFEVLHSPTIRIAPPLDPAPLGEAARRLASFDWIVVTSIHGADALLGAVGPQAAPSARPRLCAIGPATAARLERSGWPVAIVASRHGAEGVVEALAHQGVQGARVLFVRAAEIRDVVPKGLRALGAELTEVEGYRTLPVPLGSTAGEPIAALLGAGRIAAVVLTSGSTARSLRAALGAGEPNRLLGGAVVACLGPPTAAVAAELGWAVTIVAPQATGASLADALVAHFRTAGRLG